MGQDEDIPQILLGLKQPGQMLLSLIEDNDFVAHILLEKEDLRRVCGGIVCHGIHLVDKLQQYPHREDHALVRLTHGIHPQIVAA